LVVKNGDGDYMYNPASCSLYVRPSDKAFYLSYGGVPTALYLGQYNDLRDLKNNPFATYEDAFSYLTKVVFKTTGDVFLQDATTNIIDYYVPIPKEILELSQTPIVGSYIVDVVDASNVIVGDYIVIKYGLRAYQAQVLSINVNELTMDTPIDCSCSLDAIIESRTINLAVDGSVSPVVADFAPPPGAVVDINVIGFFMLDEDDMDDGTFGGIPELTKGVVLRKRLDSSGYITIFNAKTNGDLSKRAVMNYTDKAPAGQYGLRASKYMNGQGGNGVAIRLDGGKDESLQLIIQDDLTGLISFTAVARGHIVDQI